MNPVIDEIIGVCKRLIWDVKDLRYDVCHNDKSSHLVEKIRSLDVFQRIIAIHGLEKDNVFYRLCMIGTKRKKRRFMKFLENPKLKQELDKVIVGIKSEEKINTDFKQINLIYNTPSDYMLKIVPLMSVHDVSLITDIARAIHSADWLNDTTSHN
jgi:hypothetical protein